MVRNLIDLELMTAANPPLSEVTGYLDEMAASGQIPVTSERLPPTSNADRDTSLMSASFAGMAIDARPPPGKIRRPSLLEPSIATNHKAGASPEPYLLAPSRLSAPPTSPTFIPPPSALGAADQSAFCDAFARAKICAEIEQDAIINCSATPLAHSTINPLYGNDAVSGGPGRRKRPVRRDSLVGDAKGIPKRVSDIIKVSLHEDLTNFRAESSTKLPESILRQIEDSTSKAMVLYKPPSRFIEEVLDSGASDSEKVEELLKEQKKSDASDSEKKLASSVSEEGETEMEEIVVEDDPENDTEEDVMDLDE